MNKRKNILALLGAMVLTVGTVGIALAVDLKAPHQGTEITWDANGDATTNFDGGINGGECEGAELGEGEVQFHFVQSPTDSNSANLTVDFEDEADFGPAPQDGNQGSQLDWDVSVTDDGDGSVKVVNATTSADGGELKISHICAGEQTTETEPPATDEPTEEPSFEATEEGATDAPTEPNTATIGGNGTSGPADGAWLLVVALGVLLASVVVMTPARAKNRS
jgi:hypothetical protein